MQQRWNKVLISVLALVGLIVVFFIWLFTSTNYKEPSRFSNIPHSAVWKGGADEGFWLNIIEMDTLSKEVRFEIYTDYSGELALDAMFKWGAECKTTLPSLKETIYQNIVAFGSKNGMENRDEIIMKDGCQLKMIRPAFGGTYWEIEKEVDSN